MRGLSSDKDALESSDLMSRLKVALQPLFYEFCQDSFVGGRESLRQEIIENINYWLDNQNVMLHAGEMTEQELRSVKAVVNAVKLHLIAEVQ